MKNIFKKAKKGFTIVELVIVIGVIGILSAILIPTFVNLNDKATKAALQSDLSGTYSTYVTAASERDDDDLLLFQQNEIAIVKGEETASSVYYVRNDEGAWVEKSLSDFTYGVEKVNGENDYKVQNYTVKHIKQSA